MSRGRVIDVIGPERSGKTDMALTVALNGKPTLLVTMDYNYEYPLKRHRRLHPSSNITVVECFYSLPYELPDSPKSKDFQKRINAIANAVRTPLREMEVQMFSFIRKHSSKPGSANIIIDNGTLLYRDVRLASFGYLHKVPQFMYAKSNNRMHHVINEIRYSGLNAVWLHRVSKEWDEKTDKPTGRYTRDGHKAVGPDVQATLLARFDPDYTNKKTGRTGRFGVEVVDSTFNPDMVGNEYWGKNRTFEFVVAALTEE